MELTIGQQAPHFSLLDQDGETHTLTQYKNTWILLYFYPKDDTPGCTTEACSFRDNWQECKDEGLVILGISPDTVESHKKFTNKHSLPFTLLSDPEKETLQKYGVWAEKSMFGKKYMGVIRTSFLINPAGEIVRIYTKVNVKNHAKDVLKDLKNLAI